MRSTSRLILALSFLALATAPATVSATDADAPATLRFDYFHSGTAEEEHFSFDRLRVEPLPWPGNPDGNIDPLGAGKYFFEVRDAATEKLLYSRGFASIYGEWETTGEARERRRTFHESLRFPAPLDGTLLEIRILKRDAKNVLKPAWSFEVDPADMLVDRAPPPPREVIAFEDNGPPPEKLDFLILGDGYTAEECPRFEAAARHFLDVFFDVSPFKERRKDFNVWGICAATEQSGVSRPSTGVHRHTPIGTTYDAFRSERYVLTFENRRFRDVAAWAPYEFVLILANNEVYGGGGIYNLYATVAAGNDWFDYVSVHELGHHMAGLADEYYTSDVAYEPGEMVEPWEPNATATTDRSKLKWADLVDPETPLPTAWPKEKFEKHAAEIQARRRQIRAENRPEAEMSALFSEQQAFEMKLLGGAKYAGEIGAFEGANYAAKGYFRPQVDCIMFTRDQVPFCAVCRRALERVIDLYAP